MFGIWYDDGRFDTGWLSTEHDHGRTREPLEFDTEIEAERAAERERAADPEVVFAVEPRDGEHEARFRRVRKLFKERRAGHLRAELKSLGED